MSYLIKGRLDIKALERSLNFIRDRHEVLRTHFPVADGEPFQQIEPASAFQLTVVDATGAQNRDEFARSIIRAMRDTPFDLQRGPLFRVKLIKLSAEEHVLCVVVHHSVFDRESLEIFSDELAMAYTAISEGTWPNTNPLPVQYADFATWEHDILRGDAAAQLAFWQEHLAGADFVLDLPADRPRPAAPSWRAGSAEIRIPPETTYELRNLAADRGVTIFMVCFAAYYAVLARYASTGDIVVGIPVNQRSETALERMIGFFANSLPVRLKISGDLRFSDLVDQAKDAVLDAHEHAMIPFDYIVERISPIREASRNPIMQVWFDLASSDGRASKQAMQLPDLAISHYYDGTARTRFDFEMHLAGQHDGIIHGHLLYAEELFDRGTAQRFSRHYENFLTAAAANPEQRVGQIPIFDPDELFRYIEAWGTSGEDY